MDKWVHFRHYFHPAGHGTFFSAHINRSVSSEGFVWIYDCGSNRATHIRDLVSQFCRRPQARGSIDVVCVSHFDRDHVEGLEELLQAATVKVLVLPYLSLQARIYLAGQAELEDEDSSHNVAAMILNPVRYLESRDLGERVARIIVVRGGDSEDVGPGPKLDPNEPGDLNNECVEINVLTRPLETDEAWHQDSSRIEVAQHSAPWLLGGLYELMFYNCALQGDVTAKSGASLAEVAAELAVIQKDYEIFSGRPKDGWISALRNLYDMHFGREKRNDVSLVVLGRPLVRGEFRMCRAFARSFPHVSESLSLPESPLRPAILLNGDYSFTSPRLAKVREHFGIDRWGSIGVMQVPHHGSQHSWTPGLSAECVHAHSVVCAPPNARHPHGTVAHDLRHRNPVIASYSKALAFDYHVSRP
ncbi:hypothetical protein QAA18_03400 [Luteimonas sp. 8-5]|uniref:hypothetical protein n=1 Tax=Luteimonas sp. 8-5 TaxID=3039387 RepID=UPI0024373951|nr:hypothetical protein [Luteimonas sp. 8-5]MDG6347792.1 hypothetical protein [Luteimonas sp. 8-5]